MCGSASERTRAISWGETVIEECPGNSAVAPRAATSLRLLASRRPGRKRQQCFQKQNPLVPAQAGTQFLLDSRFRGNEWSFDAGVSITAETCPKPPRAP